MAFFMHFYPGYTMTLIMDEYAIWFMTMLNEAYRQEARQLHLQGQIALLPLYKNQDEFFSKLENIQKDINEVFEEADDYSGLERLKGELNG